MCEGEIDNQDQNNKMIHHLENDLQSQGHPQIKAFLI